MYYSPRTLNVKAGICWFFNHTTVCKSPIYYADSIGCQTLPDLNKSRVYNQPNWGRS